MSSGTFWVLVTAVVIASIIAKDGHVEGFRTLDIPIRDAEEGMLCSEHPAYSSSWNPVLVRTWVADFTPTTAAQDAYLTRYTGHTYAPLTDLRSTKYRGLDFYYATGSVRYPNFRMILNREAKVYMLVAVHHRNFDASVVASLRGWDSEGWARRVSGPASITYGVHHRSTRPMSTFVYVFSKHSTERYIDIPQTRFVKSRVVGIAVTGAFNLLIAEENGSPSLPVGSFRGTTITPNVQCPDSLHDVWTTPGDDPDDAQTRNMRFRTWHPIWDPCFWCAYDHDHGSSPNYLFGYAPKYGYVALKNDNENESHQGFKGVVYRTRQHYVFFSAHVQTSSLRRVPNPFHTISLVIADRATGELLVDIGQKGDYGFQSGRLASSRRNFRPLTPTDEEISRNQTDVLRLRSIPIFDPDNRDPEFFVRNPPFLGAYEEWHTLPICAKGARRTNTIRFTQKEPITAVKSIRELTVPTLLGRFFQRQFIRSANLIRTLIVRGVRIGAQYCPEGESGIFYTTPQGVPTTGPSDSSVRQYVKPGFNLVLTGVFEPFDGWLGLHGNFARGSFRNHGFALDPNVN